MIRLSERGRGESRMRIESLCRLRPGKGAKVDTIIQPPAPSPKRCPKCRICQVRPSVISKDRRHYHEIWARAQFRPSSTRRTSFHPAATRAMMARFTFVSRGCDHGSHVTWVPAAAAHLTKDAYAHDGLPAVVVLQPCGTSASFRLTVTQNGRVVASATVRQATPFGSAEPACLYGSPGWLRPRRCGRRLARQAGSGGAAA